MNQVFANSLLKSVMAAALVPFLFFSCKKDEEAPTVYPTVKATEAKEVAPGVFVVKGEINSFDKIGSACCYQFIVKSANESSTIELKSHSIKEAGVIMDTVKNLPIFQDFYFYIRLAGNSSTYSNKISFKTGSPTVTSLTPTVLSDLDRIFIRGKNFGNSQDDILVNLYTRKASNATPDKQGLEIISFTDSLIEARVPVLLGKDPDKPYFTEKIPAAQVKLENKVGDKSVLAGSVQYAYDFFLDNSTMSGKSGDSFIIYTYYSRKTPSADSLNFMFGDTKIKPIKLQEVFDISIGGEIYGSKLTFKVPFGATPGKVRISIKSTYGEAFRVRFEGVDEYTVK